MKEFAKFMGHLIGLPIMLLMYASKHLGIWAQEFIDGLCTMCKTPDDEPIMKSCSMQEVIFTILVIVLVGCACAGLGHFVRH